MSSYDNVVGGSLKLKGKPLSVGSNIKKKKKKKSKALVEGGNQGGGEEEATTPTAPMADTRTKAEKRYDEQMRTVDEKRMKEDAKKTHRERVKDFNDHLGRMSEHNDIPKVGPG
mmetsp:Transcript_36224/g.61097  ORF Transcript_36224/g.61097 Transcript_36224/m.61097 type:complete len:114 (+) Transcript_36224:290-631(+)|eukprot:CAMPEP_0198211504 /NCGR_PEP_ID=MMETSP1445-20131203/24239_1 /TAXON_ID=36898 /ORGANISM="Pyramimonas sp., Strain CCMP2087" /LENGTH=113 /DNA_ID=CAMNT_0043885777 /DNA_START=272 /DNA_END=613 /DNA_ORIENTATION=-